MMMKVPSIDWSDQLEFIVEEDDSISDFEDEPDFAEYLWMENEEEFDKNELQRLEDEERMKECFEAMIADEIEAELAEWQKAKAEEINVALSSLVVSDRNIENSLLNPLAAEFVPQSRIIDLGTS